MCSTCKRRWARDWSSPAVPRSFSIVSLALERGATSPRTTDRTGPLRIAARQARPATFLLRRPASLVGVGEPNASVLRELVVRAAVRVPRSGAGGRALTGADLVKQTQWCLCDNRRVPSGGEALDAENSADITHSLHRRHGFCRAFCLIASRPGAVSVTISGTRGHSKQRSRGSKDCHMATIAGEIGSGALRPNTTRSRVANAARHDTVQPNRRARSDGAATGSITLSVMRSVLTASEALCEHLSSSDLRSPTAADLYSAGTELAERVRRYQAASRQFVKDWLRTPIGPRGGSTRRPDRWLMRRRRGAASADPRRCNARRPSRASTATRTSPRFARPGIGIPVTVRHRRHASEDVVDVTRWTASRPMTAIVIVEQQPNDSLRTVRVKFLDPVIAATVTLAGAALPLAADFTAPVAHTLGMERKPAATPYAIRDTARRGTVDGLRHRRPMHRTACLSCCWTGPAFRP